MEEVPVGAPMEDPNLDDIQVDGPTAMELDQAAAAADEDFVPNHYSRGLLDEDDDETRPATLLGGGGGPSILSVPALRPLGPPVKAVRGFPHLCEVGKQGIAFVYYTPAQGAKWQCLKNGWCSPAFCHAAAYLLANKPAENDLEWFARFLAYIRLEDRYELPSIPDHTPDETQAKLSVVVRMATFQTTAMVYEREIEGMVLIAQEEGRNHWPNHGRILIWTHSQHVKVMWKVLRVLLREPQWQQAPPFWAADKMLVALSEDPHLLSFWREAHARYQSLLGAAGE